MNRTPALMSVVCGALLSTLLLLGQAGSQASSPQAAPLDVVINEVAWGGTAASTSDEWIELYNNLGADVDLTGWTLTDGDDVNVLLAGTIPAHGYFLLERSNDCPVSDVPADQFFTNSLNNLGERLELRDTGSLLVDSADGSSELVRLGFAQVSTYPPDVKYQDLFLEMQQRAREAERGL